MGFLYIKVNFKRFIIMGFEGVEYSVKKIIQRYFFFIYSFVILIQCIFTFIIFFLRKVGINVSQDVLYVKFICLDI